MSPAGLASARGGPSQGVNNWPLEGNRALFRKIHMEHPMQNLDLDWGGVQAERPLPDTYTPSPFKSSCLYEIFHMSSPKKCPVAFQ